MAQIITLSLLRFNSVKEVQIAINAISKYEPALNERGSIAKILISLTAIKKHMEEDEPKTPPGLPKPPEPVFYKESDIPKEE